MSITAYMKNNNIHAKILTGTNTDIDTMIGKKASWYVFKNGSSIPIFPQLYTV